MTATDQQRLGKTLWAIADQLRGAMNAADHFSGSTKMVPSHAGHVSPPDHFRGVTELIRP